MLFIIQAHEKVDQILLILKLLGGKKSIFLINIDPRANFEVDVLQHYIQSKSINAVLRRGSVVTWGGISQVLSWLDVFEFALGIGGWKFVVNMSGSCLPLVSSETVFGFLSDHATRGIEAHISFFGEPVPVTGAQYHCTQLGGEVGYSYASSDMRIIDRVDALMQTDLVEVFKDKKLDPVHNWHLRGTVHVSDLFAKRMLSVRRLFPHELATRMEFAGDHVLRGGRAWFAIERSQVSRLVDSKFARDLLSHLSNYFCPDELFFQTYFMCEPGFDQSILRRRNLHYKGGDPVEINDSMSDEILASPALFARKFNSRRVTELIGRVKSRIGQS